MEQHTGYLVSPTKKNPLIYSNNETGYTKTQQSCQHFFDTGTLQLRNRGHERQLGSSWTGDLWDSFTVIPNTTSGWLLSRTGRVEWGAEW